MVPRCRVAAVSSSITCSPVTESSDPVGSSANSTSGSATRPRASATRWASPPDSSPDRRSSSPSRPSRPNHGRAWASAALRCVPPSSSGRATFSTAVSSGTSCPNWNTNPKRIRRNVLRAVSPRVSIRCPPNHTSPRSGVKIPARQCSSVDLPEPLGPMMASISPAGHRHAGPAQRRRRPERAEQLPALDRRSSRAPRPAACSAGRPAGRSERTASLSGPSRAAVMSIQRRSASRWNSPWSASSESTSSPVRLSSVSSRMRCRCAPRWASR